MKEGGRRKNSMRGKIAVVMVALTLLASACVAEAQRPNKTHRIGVLEPGSLASPRVVEFRNGLRDLGYVDGKNIAIVYRSAGGKFDRLPGLAAELAGLKLEVIVALSTLAARPAKKATGTIPIVFASGDPLGTGLVASLARPGGNLTGLTFFSPDLIGKRLELLKEIVPGFSRIAVLWNPEGPAKAREFQKLKGEAQTLGVRLQSLEVRGPKPDLEGAFGAATREHAQALLVLGNPLTLSHRKRIAELAAQNRLPSMFDSEHFVEAGGLISYGPDFDDVYYRAAWYVDRILKGVKPADLPIEQPRKFDLVINLKTAKALGIEIPPEVLQRADKVIK